MVADPEMTGSKCSQSVGEVSKVEALRVTLALPLMPTETGSAITISSAMGLFHHLVFGHGLFIRHCRCGESEQRQPRQS